MVSKFDFYCHIHSHTLTPHSEELRLESEQLMRELREARRRKDEEERDTAKKEAGEQKKKKKKMSGTRELAS